jgi:hypothetical protein
MIIASLGLEDVDDESFEEWKNQIRKRGGLEFIFTGSLQYCKSK